MEDRNKEENITNFETVYIKEEPIEEDEDYEETTHQNLENNTNIKVEVSSKSDLKHKIDENYRNSILNAQKYYNDLKLKKRKTTLKCRFCEKIFSRGSHLNRHIRIHTNEKPYACEICKRGFSDSTHLKRHMQTHSKERPYRCEWCEKTFVRNDHLVKHIRTHSNEIVNREETETSLEKEQNLESDIPEIVTNVESLKNKQNLKSEPEVLISEENTNFEMATDTIICQENNMLSSGKNMEIYKCEMCDRIFYREKDLKLHIPAHTPKKPHKCNICGRTFIVKGTLITHIRTHTHERPYKCELCDKAYTQSGALKAHVRTHNNERPYQCELCEKAFVRKHNLMAHVRSQHLQ